MEQLPGQLGDQSPLSDKQLMEIAEREGGLVPEVQAAVKSMANESVILTKAAEPASFSEAIGSDLLTKAGEDPILNRVEAEIDEPRGVVLVEGVEDEGRRGPGDLSIVDGEIRDVRWDNNLDRDLNMAAREPRKWVDPADHAKGLLPDDERAGYQQKINEATERLRTRGYDVRILRDRDGRKRVASARRIVFGGMDLGTIGMTTEEAEQILDGMNIDVKRAREEGEKKRAEPRPTVDTPVPERREVVDSPIEALIKTYESHFNERFLRSRENATETDNISDEIDARNVLEVSGFGAISPENAATMRNWQTRISVGGTDAVTSLDEMFATAQNIYLDHILAKGILVSFAEKAKQIGLQRTITSQEPTNEIRILSRDIVKNSILVGTKREWSNDLTSNLADFLGKSYGTKEKAESVDSKVAKFYQTLKEDYSRPVDLEKDVNFLTRTQKLIDEIKETEIKTTITSVKAEQLRNELAAVAFLHDFRISSDKKSSIDADFVERAGKMDGHIKTLLNLSGQEVANKAVIDYLVAFDQAAYNFSVNHPNEYFKFNDPLVLSEVMGSRDYGELSPLYLGIAKDLYRVTGGDARYAVARDFTVLENKINYAASADVINGGAFRSVIHFRKSMCGDARKNLLIKHLDLGVTSYWEKIMGRRTFNVLVNHNSDFDPNYSRNFAILDNAALAGVAFDESGVGEGSFSEWANSMKGAAETRIKELTFMGNPSIKSWIANISGGYFYDAYGRNRTAYEKRVPYVQARLVDLTDFLISIPQTNKLTLSKQLDEAALETGLIDEALLTKFKKSRGLVTGILDQPRAIANELGRDLSGERGKLKQMKTGFDLLGIFGRFLGGIGDIFK